MNTNEDTSLVFLNEEGEEEIFYILSGQALAYDNGENVILNPGDSIICRSGEEHAMFQFRRFPTYGYVFTIRYWSIAPVGFPIRKSTDRSSCAAPRSLSQLITSFIGS